WRFLMRDWPAARENGDLVRTSAMFRYLFGPVSAQFAEQRLNRPRQQAECLAFGHDGQSDVKIGHADTWETVCSRLPSGWEPDFIALWLPYQSIPTCLWSAPVPIVGLAGDWNLLYHAYRWRLSACELVLTDKAGADIFGREGWPHVRAANLFGCERALV